MRCGQLTYPGTGLFVDTDYLITGETTKLRENGATTGVGVLAAYAYNNLGRRIWLTFGNGAVQGFAYDPVSRLASLTNQLTGTINDLTATFAYNPASQIISTVRTGDLYAWTGHFNQNVTGTPNGLNQLTAVGAKTLTHDTKGNVTAFGSDTFTYSSENLLKTGPGATTLAYDPIMRLYQTVSGATTMRLAYDGLDRIAEYNGSNVLQRRYVHGPAIDEPLVWYEGTGTTNRRFLSADERGSIVSVTDTAGAVLGLNKYDEYGQPQATNLGAFGYTGQAWLPSVGVWYYKARVYEPELGRFLQPDQIGYWDSANLYAYVLDDPMNLIDPLGLFWRQIPFLSCSDNQCFEHYNSEWVEDGTNNIGGSLIVASRGSDGGGGGSPQNGHRYRTNNKVCGQGLSPQQRASLLSFGAIPGHEESVRENGTYLAAPYGIPGGYVNTRFSGDHNQVVNVTTWLHAFSWSVTRTIYSNSSGTFIETIGVGSGDSILGGIRDSINEAVGPQIFDDIDRSLSDRAHANIPGC